MRITRQQIRDIIEESLNEGNMKERFGEIQAAVEDILEMSPGASGQEVAKYVMSDLSDYGMAAPEMAITQEEVFNALDIMMEDGQVFFDIEEDQWYMADSPQAQAAMKAMVER